MLAKNLSVGERLGLGFGLVGLLFALVVWQYHHGIFNVMHNFETLQNTQAAKKVHFLNVHRYMLEARRSEKDFLARKSLDYPKRVAEYVDLIVAETDKLMDIEDRTASHPVGGAIKDLILNYHVAFNKIVDAWQINGLDHNSGLQGKFRNTIHNIEDLAKNFKTSRLLLTLLQIRRAEKDLGLRKEQQYLTRVRVLIKQLNNQINTSTLDEPFKARLVSSLALYQVNFAEYANEVLQDKFINGGKGPFRNVAHTLEKQLSQHYVPNLEEEILTLRRREKDFLLRGKAGYVQMVQATVAEILANIDSSNISVENKTIFSRGVRQYEEDFLALVNHNMEIVELTAKMRDAVHQIEPLVAKGVAEAVTEMNVATKTTSQQTRDRTTIALAIALFATVLGIIFAIYFSRRITRPVNTLTQLAELFAPPEHDPNAIEPGQKDEIVILTNAMGRMTGHLQDIVYYFNDHVIDLKTMAKTLEINKETTISKEEKMKMARTLKNMSDALEKKMGQLDI